MRNFLKLCATFVGLTFAVALLVPLLPHAGDIAQVLTAVSVPTAGLFFVGAVADRIYLLPQITVANTDPDNVRAETIGKNNVRTERYQLRVRGQVDITVAGTGILNRGSILGALRDIGFSDGGTDKHVLDARLARFIAEAWAPSPLPATRLANAGIQAATQLEETVPIFLAAPRTINLNDTKWVEVNKQLQQTVFITPQRLITNVATGPALVGTVTNVVATVEQLFDEMNTVPPMVSPFVNYIVQDVPAANPRLRIDLRNTKYLRAIVIQQDTNLGEVTDIVNGVSLLSDKMVLIGEAQVPWLDLVLAQAYENGGALPLGYLMIDLCRYGRLSSMWNPYEDTNLRLELNVQPSAVAGVTASRLRVALIQYEQTAVTAKPLPLAI